MSICEPWPDEFVGNTVNIEPPPPTHTTPQGGLGARWEKNQCGFRPKELIGRREACLCFKKKGKNETGSFPGTL